tara:strand:+ start:310 stop:1236 length:927 start_codon:yes stop_codon:yes gene_type:complete
MKIYLNDLNESWVVDRLKNEWNFHNAKITTNRISKSDIIWIIAPWVWKNVSKKHLSKKKVICSIYHLDFTKFDDKQKKDFYYRDEFVDQYHVISQKTKKDLSELTSKKIISIPFWVNQNIFRKLDNKEEIRKTFGFKDNDYLIGSFQRDTEGIDLKTPKLIKGPDILLEILIQEYKNKPNMKVVLAGKRRQFILKELDNYSIPYKYFEMIDESKLNLLYNILDLYIVSSRLEGGPQAILECAISETPIISTNVGVAPEILSKGSIFQSSETYKSAIPDSEEALKNVKKYSLPNGMSLFENMFVDFYEN